MKQENLDQNSTEVTKIQSEPEPKKFKTWLWVLIGVAVIALPSGWYVWSSGQNDPNIQLATELGRCQQQREELTKQFTGVNLKLEKFKNQEKKIFLELNKSIYKDYPSLEAGTNRAQLGAFSLINNTKEDYSLMNFSISGLEVSKYFNNLQFYVDGQEWGERTILSSQVRFGYPTAHPEKQLLKKGESMDIKVYGDINSDVSTDRTFISPFYVKANLLGPDIMTIDTGAVLAPLVSIKSSS